MDIIFGLTIAVSNLRNQDVFRFEVPMSYVLTVQEAEGVEYLLGDEFDILLRKCSLLGLLTRHNEFVQLAVFQEF